MNISQIEIFIHSSIPNYKDPIKLTKNIIYNPSYKEPNDLNEYPFITDTVTYSISELTRMIVNDYSKIVKFFFNIKYFKEKLSELVLKDDKSSVKYNNESILKSNIMIMLEFLFPTSFPNKNNLYSSFDNYILQKNDTKFSFSLKNTSFSKYIFSYLSINSKVYTITKIVWLNDIYNNPIYKKFVGDYINFTEKLEREKKRIDEIIDRKLNTLYNYVNSENYLWNDIEIKKIIFKNVVWFPKEGSYSDKIDLNNDNRYENNYNEYFNQCFKTENLKEILNKSSELKLAFNGIKITKDYTNQQSKEDTFIKKLLFFNNIKKILDNLNTNQSFEDIRSNLNIDELYDLTIITNEGFELISNVPQKNKQSYRKLTQDIKDIYTYHTIKDKYMKPDQLNINIKDEEEFIITKLKSDFKIFISFIENIKEILPGQKESTNTNLQKMINDYSTQGVSKENKNKCGFDETIRYIYENFVKRTLSKKTTIVCSNILDEDHFYTGLAKINNNDFDKPQYEAHIHMNLIEGEVNNDNITNFICKYKGLYLGKELEHIVVDYNKYDVLEDSLFFKLDDKSIKSLEINKPIKKGGKYSLRSVSKKKQRRYHNKTIRFRKYLRNYSGRSLDGSTFTSTSYGKSNIFRRSNNGKKWRTHRNEN